MTGRSLKYLIICIFLSLELLGNVELEFEKLNSNNGLSSEEIRAIFQDSEGYMWFLTPEGLNRYDGYEIINIGLGEHKMTLSSAAFESICEDRDGRIWLGTAENGLMVYDRKTNGLQTFEAFSDGLAIDDDHIRTLLPDNNGNIWIGTEYGLYVYNIFNNEIMFYNLGNRSSEVPAWCIIESMIQDNNGNIWIGTWNMGLFIFEPSSGELLNFNTFNASQATINENRIKSIYQDNLNNVWIGTWEDGLYQVHLEENSLITDRVFLYDNSNNQTIAGDIIYALNQDDAGNLWVGTPYGLTIIENLYSNKPYFKNISHEMQSNEGLSNNEVWKIFKDKSGLMWLGTLEGGVNKVHSEGKAFTGFTIPSVSTQIYSQTIQSFCIDPYDNLLIGVKSLGFGQYRLDSKEYIPYINTDVYSDLPLNINSVACFYVEGTTALWIGTRYNGLIVYDYQTRTYLTVNEFDPSFTYETVNVLCPSTDGSVWVGTNGGLFHIWRCKDDPDCFYIEVVEMLYGMKVLSIVQDKNGQIWAGTSENGLWSLNLTSPEFDYVKYSREDESLPSNRIYSLYESSNGDILAGTSDAGLLKYADENKSFESFSEAKGQRIEKIFGITEDKHKDLWMTTNNGLVRISTKEGRIQTDFYTITDGMQGNIFVPGSIFVQNNNRIFIGGYYGFNAFFPSDVKPNTYVPTTTITEILVNDTIFNYSKLSDGKVRLSHQENNITFKFSALSFYKPDKNIFAYILEGLHDEWQYADASVRITQFQELGAGEYVFKVKSANSSELWNEIPVSFEFEVLPAPYKTWWAYLGYSLIFIVILITIFRFLLKNEKVKRELEIEKIEHAKSEKLNQFKLRFFTNISHEILTPLSIISCSVDMIRSQTRKGREEFGVISRNIIQLDKLLHQLLDYRKMESGHLKLMVEKGDIHVFIGEIVESFAPLAKRAGNILHYDHIGSSFHCWFDSDKLYKILDNLISNAIKYTPEGGIISIRCNINIIEGKQHAEIIVSDTGRGIKAEDMEKIFMRFYRADEESSDTGTGIGLAFTKNIVILHGGNIDVKSEVGKGSVFTVKIPIDQEAYKPEQIKDTD